MTELNTAPALITPAPVVYAILAGQPVLTPEQLAVRWMVSVKTLKNWRDKSVNKGPRYMKLGRKVFYPLSHIGEYEVGMLDAGKKARG